MRVAEFFPGVALLCVLLSAPAAGAAETYLDRLQTELKIKQELATAQTTAQTEAQAALAKIQADVTAAAQSEQKQAVALASLQARLAALEQQHQVLAQQTAESHRGLGAITAALVRLRQFSPGIVVQAALTQDPHWLKQAAVLKAILPSWQRRLATVEVQEKALADLTAALKADAASLLTAQAAFRARQADLRALLRGRQQAIKEQAVAWAEARAAASHAAKNAKTLQELLDHVRRPAAGNNTTEEHASILPVMGQITRGFGAKDDVGQRQRGLSIAAPAGSMVLAPGRGKVVYAGPFKGYDRIVIIDHGHNVHSLLAGLAEVNVAVGQMVLLGEPVAMLGDEQITKTSTAGKTATLYYERRIKGTPVSPFE